MIDLSYLTEEEQVKIMSVLKRDEELKRAEEQRVKQLQNSVPEEGRLKYMTGEWFYQAKSQRHMDRIHGSEIIMASMKRKPNTSELTPSLGERLRKMSRKIDAVPPKPPRTLMTGLQSPANQSPEREKRGEPVEAPQETLKSVLRSPKKPRHNPFNSIPVDADLEEFDKQLAYVAQGPERSPGELTRGCATEAPRNIPKCPGRDMTTGSSDTSQEKPPRRAPVPRKRTKIKISSGSVSDSSSTVSAQSHTGKPPLRCPAPRTPLKPRASSRSTDFSNQPSQPLITPRDGSSNNRNELSQPAITPRDGCSNNRSELSQPAITPRDGSSNNRNKRSQPAITPTDGSSNNRNELSQPTITPRDGCSNNRNELSQPAITPRDGSSNNRNKRSQPAITPTDGSSNNRNELSQPAISPRDGSSNNRNELSQPAITPRDGSSNNRNKRSQPAITPTDGSSNNRKELSQPAITPRDGSSNNRNELSQPAITPRDGSSNNRNELSQPAITPRDGSSNNRNKRSQPAITQIAGPSNSQSPLSQPVNTQAVGSARPNQAGELENLGGTNERKEDFLLSKDIEPMAASAPLENSGHIIESRDKPKLYPRLRRRSSLPVESKIHADVLQPNVDKTVTSDVLVNKDSYKEQQWPSDATKEDQEEADIKNLDKKNKLNGSLNHKDSNTTLTINICKASNDISSPQPSKIGRNKMDRNVCITSKEMPRVIQRQQAAPNQTSVDLPITQDDSISDLTRIYHPPSFQINKKPGHTGTDNPKPQLQSATRNTRPIEDQEESIAKVLEWFSRSTDSSDKLDSESIEQEQESIKEDDIDFENEINLRTKPANNVYPIIPRRCGQKTPELDSMIQAVTDWGEEQSAEESVPLRIAQSPKEKINYELPSLVELPVIAPIHPPLDKDKDNISKQHVPVAEVSQQVILQSTAHEENQPQKLANLRTFWERENKGPKILISRSNLNETASAQSNRDIDDQSDTGVELPEQVQEPPKVLQSYPASDGIQEAISNPEKTEESGAVTEDLLYIEEPVDRVVKNAGASLSVQHDQKNEQLLPNTTSDLEVTVPPMQSKTQSSSIDSGSLPETQTSGSVRYTSTCSSEEYRMSSGPEREHRLKSDEQECQVEAQALTKTCTHVEPKNSAALSKSGIDQPDSKTDKIKQLRSFWEKDNCRSKMRGAQQANKAKLNKRFTKSAFDLRDMDSHSGDDSDDPVSSNFTRQGKSSVTESMNNSQFKNLRDFWGGSPSKQSGLTSPSEEDRNTTQTSQTRIVKTPDTFRHMVQESPVNPKTTLNLSNNSKPESIEACMESLGNENNLSSSSVKALTDRKLQFTPLEEKTSVASPSKGRSERTSSRDTLPPRPQLKLEKEPLPQQVRTASKSSPSGITNALRRTNSMYAANIVHDEDLNIHMQSSAALNASASQPSRSSEGSGSPQPLARSVIPKDIQHYLGIGDTGGAFAAGPELEETRDMVCTSFCAEPELDPCVLSGPVRASTPLGLAEPPCGRRSQGPPHTAHSRRSDASQGSLKSSLTESSSCSRTSSIRDGESPVQKALRRAVNRPVLHKSLEDITAPTSEHRSGPHSDTKAQAPAAPSPPTSTFSESDRIKELSKSVPSFLQKERDEEESSSTSDNSLKSPTDQKAGRSLMNLSVSSRFASLSSVGGSIMSISSSDFGNIEIQGTIQFTITYAQKLREFHIFVIQCKDLAAADHKRNRSDPYVKSYLIPDTTNLGKRKTSVKKRTLNPTYNEILRYRVRTDYLRSQVLNLSVWHNDVFGRNCFLGEVQIDLSTWDFSKTPMNNLPLRPKAMPVLQPPEYRGEMRLALRFLPGTSHSGLVPSMGEVHIWVKDCKNLPLVRGVAVDPFVKCFVLPDTSRKSRQKTRVLKRTTNPVFNHTMVYDGFQADDLKEACVELTVWDRNRLANQLLGGLRLGLGTGKSYGAQVDWMDSSTEEVTLWQRMMGSSSEWVEDVLPLRMLMTAKNA